MEVMENIEENLVKEILGRSKRNALYFTKTGDVFTIGIKTKGKWRRFSHNNFYTIACNIRKKFSLH